MVIYIQQRCNERKACEVENKYLTLGDFLFTYKSSVINDEDNRLLPVIIERKALKDIICSSATLDGNRINKILKLPRHMKQERRLRYLQNLL